MVYGVQGGVEGGVHAGVCGAGDDNGGGVDGGTHREAAAGALAEREGEQEEAGDTARGG